ncbi:hypothetical protein HPB50_009627 [Hyalomma asiaticum]|uniref:Uncharacterized protein n=1 Tax=Hyalomma asiaticum TaxID=266040 RepID=A0ACB7THT7_HYAAI|nr:hypothetical protein HPB50_009627 [Hyalomma asiaticum]
MLKHLTDEIGSKSNQNHTLAQASHEAARSVTVDELVSKLIQKYLPARSDGDLVTQLPDYRGPPCTELDEDFCIAEEAIDVTEEYLRAIGLRCSAAMSEHLLYSKEKGGRPQVWKLLSESNIRLCTGVIPRVDVILFLGLFVEFKGGNGTALRKIIEKKDNAFRLWQAAHSRTAGLPPCGILEDPEVAEQVTIVLALLDGRGPEIYSGSKTTVRGRSRVLPRMVPNLNKSAHEAARKLTDSASSVRGADPHPPPPPHPPLVTLMFFKTRPLQTGTYPCLAFLRDLHPDIYHNDDACPSSGQASTLAYMHRQCVTTHPRFSKEEWDSLLLSPAVYKQIPDVWPARDRAGEFELDLPAPTWG